METFSPLLAICAGNSPVTDEFPAQRPVNRNFGVFYDLRLNKRLSKQSRSWWFETPSRPLWCHCNEYQSTFAAPKFPRIIRLLNTSFVGLSGIVIYHTLFHLITITMRFHQSWWQYVINGIVTLIWGIYGDSYNTSNFKINHTSHYVYVN